MQFFAAHNITPKPGKAYVVLVGITAVLALWILGICTIARIRKYSYRIFYGFHHAMFVVIMLCLFIHVSVARPFVLESLLVYVLNQLLRSNNTQQLPAELSLNTNSSVLRIMIPLSSDSKDYPVGSSVNISTGSRRWIQRICTGFSANPFTITYERSTSTLIAYAKIRGKRTTALSNLSKQTMLSVEGPYGKSTTYENSLPGYLMNNTNRVLLIAGGVGATFGFSVALDVLERLHQTHIKKVREFLTVVWVVRDKDDVAWADEILQRDSKTSARAVLADVVTIYYSRPSWKDVDSGAEPDLSDLVEDSKEDQLMKPLTDGTHKQDGEGINKPQLGRPSFKEIVADFLGDMAAEKTAAVAVCGPGSMCRDVRQTVTYHIKKGTKIWWHEEKFGK